MNEKRETGSSFSSFHSCLLSCSPPCFSCFLGAILSFPLLEFFLPPHLPLSPSPPIMNTTSRTRRRCTDVNWRIKMKNVFQVALLYSPFSLPWLSFSLVIPISLSLLFSGYPYFSFSPSLWLSLFLFLSLSLWLSYFSDLSSGSLFVPVNRTVQSERQQIMDRIQVKELDLLRMNRSCPGRRCDAWLLLAQVEVRA